MLSQAVLITVMLSEHRRRERAEVAARQRMSELAHVNRYTMAGELTTTIAHELTQPLAAILVNADTAKLIINSPFPNMGYLSEIISEIRRDDQRAGEIIKRLRSLLKRTPFEEKPIDLNRLVAQSTDLISAVANTRDISLSTVLSEADLLVIGDNIQLQQVLINLIVNSMDALANREGSQRRNPTAYSAGWEIC